jgi:hypothetical protein
MMLSVSAELSIVYINNFVVQLFIKLFICKFKLT